MGNRNPTWRSRSGDMATGDPLYRRDPEVCRRCQKPFGKGEKLYVISTHVLGQVLGGYIGLYSTEPAPVCFACLNTKRDEEDKDLVERVCLGCGRVMMIRAHKWWGRYSRWRVPRHTNNSQWCSNRCRQRVKRRARRRHRVVQCGVCGFGFSPARKDARYCSPRCRQKAHRRS